MNAKRGAATPCWCSNPRSGLDGRVKTGRKGVGEIELIATGRAAHAGLNPEDGINAIEEIALQIARISRWNQPRRGITVNAGVIEGGTRTNVIPERARVLVDCARIAPGDMRALERKFRALRPILAGAKLEVRGGFNRPPMERKMSAALYAKARALANEMGVTLGEAFVGGGSDGNFTAALGVPTLDGLGAVGEGAHSPRENIVVRALPERAALVAGLLLVLEQVRKLQYSQTSPESGSCIARSQIGTVEVLAQRVPLAAARSRWPGVEPRPVHVRNSPIRDSAEVSERIPVAAVHEQVHKAANHLVVVIRWQLRIFINKEEAMPHQVTAPPSQKGLGLLLAGAIAGSGVHP